MQRLREVAGVEQWLAGSFYDVSGSSAIVFTQGYSSIQNGCRHHHVRRRNRAVHCPVGATPMPLGSIWSMLWEPPTLEPQQRLLNRCVFSARAQPCWFYHVTPGFRQPRYFYIKNRSDWRRLRHEVSETIRKAFKLSQNTISKCGTEWDWKLCVLMSRSKCALYRYFVIGIYWITY